MYARKKIVGKWYYFLKGFKSKVAANKDAQRVRKLGHGARVVPGTGQFKGWYYVYTTQSAGWRP